MKKILLFATAFAFSFTLMAQTKTQDQAETRRPLDKKVTKDQTAPVKLLPEVKPQAEQAQSQISPDDVIKVNTVKHDFGKIKQGTPVIFSFEIKNTSDKPVVVENTYASCGCTTPDKIVEPIAPGATSKLKVQYSAAAMGSFTKDVHIKLAGITQEKIVQITGEVITPEPPKEDKPNN
jgi:Protein of unknown function (DUF1573)